MARVLMGLIRDRNGTWCVQRKVPELLQTAVARVLNNGKAMFVAIDKATAVRMYGKVRDAWTAELASREKQLAKAPEVARGSLAERLDWMRSVDMAVIVSQGQNEIDDLKRKGLDILPHRERMQKEDLESKFKDPDDPLQCASGPIAISLDVGKA